ncbi:metabotropic glutamate receptor 8-like isoform X2 [Neocloeon triangulifer]|uniref:metabotropic glutamate receptor 8-like isoform X2 n=1 Tax=Neocloeon triangulifer TaxID=2078957 RepID=UPI00286FAD70|nr:metabotropic glutamate receptor 8-like isoform X2 [Neocloeon triangulifer]
MRRGLVGAAVVVLVLAWVEAAGADGDETRLLRMNGDIILGGIFPMHEHRSGGYHAAPCGAVKEEKGVQRLEAMLYALDEINRDATLLPGLSLGALVIDSCSSDTYALEQSMEFVRSYMNQDMSEYKCASGQPPVYVPHKPVTGVIGASFSVVSIMVANILRLFKIPQMSYASTSTELSDKSRFEYFSRVVPPDNFQAQAMVEMVRELGWKYVSTVAVEGDYGEKGIASFIELATSSGICIAVSEKILRNAQTEDFDKIVERLVQKANARGVIMFVDEDNTRKLLQATVRANRTGHFLWFGSDSWGAKVHPVKEQEWAAEGAITILPRRTAIKEFDEYYKSLRPRLDKESCRLNSTTVMPQGNKLVNCRNIWFREFWSQHHKCAFDDSSALPKCTGNETINDYEQEGLVPYVVDAVYAMAQAIHNMITDVCGADPFILCNKLRPAPAGADLLEYIRNLTFTGRQGTEIKFNKDGDAFGSYNIYQYQKKDDKYDYVKIGTWEARLNLDMRMTKWKNGTVPKSICSENCAQGHIRNFQDQCCWSCVACREDAYAFNDTCKACEPGHAPSADKAYCVKLPAQVIEWDSPWALVPLAFAVIGILSTIFVLLVFIRYNKTPIIMASGRELCYVLLIGIFACYLMTFAILARPTQLSCTILRVGLGVCLTVCYSAIITKTNRISRIFNRGIRSIQRPSCTSPSSQVIICLGIVSVQLLGAIGWLIYEKPDVKEVYPYPLTAVLTCGVSTFSLMMSLVYNMFLILLCTLYAFKTRKIPENFNEAKYIGFTMYSTCIVWLAFVPIYFGTNNDYKVQIASTCMCVNISATVALGCLFAPKVYIVLFQPKKNVRQGNTQVRSTRFSASQEDPGTGVAGISKQRPGSSSTYVMRFSGRAGAGCMGMQSSQSAQSMTSGSVSPNKHVNGEPSTLASPSVEESSLS